MLHGYDDEITEKIEIIFNAEVKNVFHQFLVNYNLGKEDIFKKLYEFQNHSSKVFFSQNFVFFARFIDT